MLLISEIMLTFCTYRRAIRTPNVGVVWQLCWLTQSPREAWWETRVPDSSKRLTAQAQFAKRGLVTKHVRTKVNSAISVAKTRIARIYYLNLIYFCKKFTIFTKFYEFRLQKVLKFANYAVAVLVFFSNYAKDLASTIRQGLSAGGELP